MTGKEPGFGKDLKGGQPIFRPARTAVLIGAVYLLFCSAYIWLSGRLAARSAESVSHLQRIEALKGVAFVFTRFYTTKSHGTGLGLVCVKACAAVHGGRVEIGASPLGGARFRVVLPLGARRAEEAGA